MSLEPSQPLTNTNGSAPIPKGDPSPPAGRPAPVQALTMRARVALVVGLWVLLLAIVTFAVRNLGWVASWANGVLLSCLTIVGLVIIFSLLAAAVEISIETISGRYPRGRKDT